MAEAAQSVSLHRTNVRDRKQGNMQYKQSPVEICMSSYKLRCIMTNLFFQLEDLLIALTANYVSLGASPMPAMDKRFCPKLEALTLVPRNVNACEKRLWQLRAGVLGGTPLQINGS